MKERRWVLFCFLTLLIVFPEFIIHAVINPPHDQSNSINCESCHFTYSSTPSWWNQAPLNMDDTPRNRLCLRCHEDTIAPKVSTHSSLATESTIYGAYSKECVVCHNPHMHEQAGNEGYSSLAGIIASINGPRTFTLSISLPDRTGDGDPTDDYRGWTIVPNTRYRTINYKIVTNSVNSVTVSSDIDTTRITAGSAFSIIPGRYVKATLPGYGGYHDVMFLAEEGTNSFAVDEGGTGQDDSADGICQVCHSRTKYWHSDGSLAVHNSARRCTLCHPHQNGFRPSCDICHGNPPVTSSSGGPDGLVDSEAGTGATTPGAHQKHVLELGYDCTNCHDGGMPETPAYDKVIQIGFNILRTYTGGIYDGRNGLANGYAYGAGNGATTVTNGGAMSCSNIYCHGNFQGSGLDASPLWNDPSTGACGTCHGASNTTPPSSGSHEKHAGNSVIPGSNTYDREYPCTTCHYGIVSGSGPDSYTISDKDLHVNTKTEWAFDPDDPRLQGGSESYSIPSGTQPPSDGTTPRPYGTCDNIYCHSNVQPDGGVGPPNKYTTPQWGTNMFCTGCHVPAGGEGIYHGTNIITGSHSSHIVAQTDPDRGYAYECQNCHNWSGISGIAGGTCNSIVCHAFGGNTIEKNYHVNGSVDVIFSTFIGGTYNGTPRPGDGYGNCDNTYCHSSGESLRTGSYPPNTSPQWGQNGTIACNGCHGNNTYSPPLDGMPAYPNGNPKENSHTSHVVTYGIGCSTCHYYTTRDDGFSIFMGSIHINGKYSVYPHGTYNGTTVIFSYDLANPSLAGRCYNVSCHPGNASAIWGGSLN